MRIVVTGASGQLGSYVLDRLDGSGHEVIGWSRSTGGSRGRTPIEPVDLIDPDALAAALDRTNPDAILHLAAISRVDRVLADPALASTVNADASGTIADWASSNARRLVFTSTDLVFDGSRAWWREDDSPRPILGYGRSKQEGERRVLRHPSHLVARLSLLYGPSRCGRPTFLDAIIDALRRRESRSLFLDEFRTPLDYATAAEALARLVESPEIIGILHVGGVERVSRFEMLRRLAAHAGLPVNLLRGNRQDDAPGPEPRPSDVSLDTSRLEEWLPALDRPTLEGGLERCLR
ncbi:SDR family oxidoreductase [Tautonia plasticadhaerens]|uniref:dTDP-4-dehydrorhamnose reductase n=1 Tax=Tautonia plasticadhaerens TaxID=2527974 RepID=A0A518H6V3_9BACT|nr:SDR family oxidoreductase [Tautonia plasticadhaerens]QDV36563.1 dTDP-4-dehydrorhamnose reductase [Tautonia plasticadhaerens]